MVGFIGAVNNNRARIGAVNCNDGILDHMKPITYVQQSPFFKQAYNLFVYANSTN